VSETIEKQFTIAGNRFRLRHDEVERRMQSVLPDPITSHFVVVNGRRYPPKQVIREVTGLDRADFTTHQARRVVLRLGFPTGRKQADDSNRRAHRSEPGTGLVDALRALRGLWVAVKGDDVLVSAGSANEVVAWLARHDQRADSMFRVPEREVEATGIAPL
jgi:hypothetical protein